MCIEWLKSNTYFKNIFRIYIYINIININNISEGKARHPAHLTFHVCSDSGWFNNHCNLQILLSLHKSKSLIIIYSIIILTTAIT